MISGECTAWRVACKWWDQKGPGVPLFFLKKTFLANNIPFKQVLLCSKHEKCHDFITLKLLLSSKALLKLFMLASEIYTEAELHCSVFFWGSGFDCFPKAKMYSGKAACWYAVWFSLNFCQFPCMERPQCRALSVHCSCRLLIELLPELL